MAKKITIDLRTAPLFGPSCKCLEMFEDFRYRGYQIDLIAKEWANDCKGSGVVYDKEKGEFQKGSSLFLWDPKQHPVDFYENLVVSTFENVHYAHVKEKKDLFSKIGRACKRLFSPTVFTHYDWASRYMEPLELVRYHQQSVDRLLGNKGIKAKLQYLYFLLYLKIFRHLKPYADSKGFRYRLHPNLLTEEVESIIQEAKSHQVPYVLVSANWDDRKQFEKQDDRLRGILYDELEFNNMVRYVRRLDEYAQEGKLRFVLASKKAADWDKVIKSDFLDLRNFERLGLSLSQTIYILQEISSITINWPSTFAIWMTACSSILHLTWRDNKDTAAWARNNLHKHHPEHVLDQLGIKLRTKEHYKVNC
ncbi:hypothetical protein JYU14_02400 [Simkania negevensis]|uniref:Uncharacterized protein n=1 Tax=Simkania negevensis TaxID=83561 RepID=A0ABS3ARC7_9BACT|nr:hypothetical protein [Simkania negevensis]